MIYLGVWKGLTHSLCDQGRQAEGQHPAKATDAFNGEGPSCKWAEMFGKEGSEQNPDRHLTVGSGATLTLNFTVIMTITANRYQANAFKRPSAGQSSL